MAILYRAIWSDSNNDVVGMARREFLEWVSDKTGGELRAADTDQTTSDGSRRLRIESEAIDKTDAPVRAVFRASLVENQDDGSRWTTTVRSWQGPGVASEPGGLDGWIWVDVEAVTYDSLDNTIVAAPRFIRPLLAAGATPFRLDVPLRSSPESFTGEDGAERLADLITNIDRDIPIVVFSPLPESFHVGDLPVGVTALDRFNEIVNRAAAIVAGLALVARLDRAAMLAFKDAVGEAYEVRDGAFRIYLPGLDPAMDEAWRHRYTVPNRFIRYRDTAGRLISRAISLRAGARRAPSSYELADAILGASRSKEPGEWEELLGMADNELATQHAQLDALDQKYLDAIDEQQQLEEENNRLRVELEQAFKKLALAGLSEEQAQAVAEVEAARPPASADSPSHAAALAREHLGDHLFFPAGASEDLTDLDSAVESRAWGEASWRAFLALHAYGEALTADADPGSFWTWCATSGHPYAWPATTKKLAMRESESVNRSRKLRAKRIFPVARSLDPTGEKYMESHIKIAEGGGVLAPRIYFCPSKETGGVHIGYFGPHKNVPNTLT